MTSVDKDKDKNQDQEIIKSQENKRRKSIKEDLDINNHQSSNKKVHTEKIDSSTINQLVNQEFDTNEMDPEQIDYTFFKITELRKDLKNDFTNTSINLVTNLYNKIEEQASEFKLSKKEINYFMSTISKDAMGDALFYEFVNIGKKLNSLFRSQSTEKINVSTLVFWYYELKTQTYQSS
ncbi:hypothetical protein KGF54_001802 [Candida jiufengensis]|uniref:uncharacterized protein n=1 Tax=Candida jiufengensis TaxID=497108 RepID=UPI002225831C|nr:uncharacterized protein KGF54_001802 [Candida jiufengensis]KAI5955241.1 hypothetical protein KGF54_001802 [Candida jiufengensis]